ncbi:MAG: hypothetical protein JXR37_18930 [Kiritimatiellae bacterium]|nr:hypothetical protein [Kiritimatiellia bacterium]
MAVWCSLGTLFVYYGGADKYVCVATCPLDELVGELRDHPYGRRSGRVL